MDTESQKFILWSQRKLANKNFINQLTEAIVKKFRVYADMPTFTLTRIIKVKLQKGAIEHKTLKQNSEEIERELKMEFQDLFGWSLMDLYIKEASHSDNPKDNP